MSEPLHRRAWRAYADGGLSTVLDRGLRSFFAEPRLSPRLHWHLAARYYRYRCANDVRAYPSSPDPFKLEWVDPARIRRHTRRTFPPWRGRVDRFGEVRPGDWDSRRRPDVEPDYQGPPPDLFVADAFTESVLYRSMADHFEHGVPWEETAMFERTRRLLESEDRERVWQDCRSVEDLRRRFEYLDDLYRSIERSGVRSQRKPAKRDPEKGFRYWLRGEITVDVGRDGELLLVCGKHRLAIAKLLGADRVPVLFLVRHPDWMDRRSRALETGAVDAHPDLRDLPADSAPTPAGSGRSGRRIGDRGHSR